jgi:hypothetical protein
MGYIPPPRIGEDCSWPGSLSPFPDLDNGVDGRSASWLADRAGGRMETDFNCKVPRP